MHQVISLREYYNDNTGKTDKTDSRHFKLAIRPESLTDLFNNLEKYIQRIPEAERYNFFYTVASCTDKKREFREQSNIIFDIDGIDIEDDAHAFELDGIQFTKAPVNPAYIKALCTALNVPVKDIGFVFSGNGLHAILQLKTPILDSIYFTTHRAHYQALCAKIKVELQKNNLPGEPDPSVFDPRRIMRLPGTTNQKPNKPERLCVLMKGDMTPIDFDLGVASGLPQIEAIDHIVPQILKKFPTPDTPAVLEGCDFLRWCKEKPNEISEAQWYAMLSILPRLPASGGSDGRRLSHAYSEGHHSYTAGETESKIEQAMQASGPRTCQNINKLWSKCEGCKNFGKVTSPIMIQSAQYVRTKDNGFHDIVMDKNGNPRPGKPNYDDLIRFFYNEHPYAVLGSSETCFTWTGTYWREMKDPALKAFAQDHFNPSADTAMAVEFKNRLIRKNMKPEDWWVDSIHKKINFNNGVLDLITGDFLPHSTEFGFRYCLGYDYNPNAKAPEFEKFMMSIMDDREELVKILLEFAGYAFSNDDCWLPVSLMLSGDGSNGKSTFMRVLKALAGNKNFSTVSLKDINEPVHRQRLDGKLFNISEETPTSSLMDSSIFKSIVDGSETTVKVLYKQPYDIKNRAKFIFACNELPQTKDTTYGFFRRFIIVPFEKCFEGATKDNFIIDKLLLELPGIFNLVLEGHKRLTKQRGFTKSTVIEEQMNEYKLDVDSVLSFLQSSVTISPNAEDTTFITIQALYTSYQAYTLAHGERYPVNYSVFCRRISRYIRDKFHDLSRRKRNKLIKGVWQKGLHGLTYADGSDY